MVLTSLDPIVFLSVNCSYQYLTFSGLSLCFLNILGRGGGAARSLVPRPGCGPCDGGPALSSGLPCSPRRAPSPFQTGFLSNLEEKDKINNGLYLALFCKPWDSTLSLT